MKFVCYCLNLLFNIENIQYFKLSLLITCLLILRLLTIYNKQFTFCPLLRSSYQAIMRASIHIDQLLDAKIQPILPQSNQIGLKKNKSRQTNPEGDSFHVNKLPAPLLTPVPLETYTLALEQALSTNDRQFVLDLCSKITNKAVIEHSLAGISTQYVALMLKLLGQAILSSNSQSPANQIAWLKVLVRVKSTELTMSMANLTIISQLRNYIQMRQKYAERLKLIKSSILKSKQYASTIDDPWAFTGTNSLVASKTKEPNDPLAVAQPRFHYVETEKEVMIGQKPQEAMEEDGESDLSGLDDDDLDEFMDEEDDYGM